MNIWESNLQSLIWMINLLFIFLVCCFGYILLEDTIHEYLSRPRYSKKALEAYSKKREQKRQTERAENWDLVENGIHVKTGLIDDKFLPVIISSCTSCHSAKLITQNRATRAGWKQMIVWMQATQGLQDLGANEVIILDYLSKHYAPEAVGRRANLDTEAIEWYLLNLEE